MPKHGFGEGQNQVQHVALGESTKVNVNDHEYEVEHDKRNRPEILKGGGSKKRWIRDPIVSYVDYGSGGPGFKPRSCRKIFLRCFSLPPTRSLKMCLLD